MADKIKKDRALQNRGNGVFKAAGGSSDAHHNQQDPQIKDEPATEQSTSDRSHKNGGLQSTDGSTGVPQPTAHQDSSYDTTQKIRGEATHQDRAGSQQTNNN
ncbi:hypothetical protein D6C93_10444 [Aureobasidium pullulans]|nr:hypothetical protein D6C93_10444 [Aureobasidium pullulans]